MSDSAKDWVKETNGGREIERKTARGREREIERDRETDIQTDKETERGREREGGTETIRSWKIVTS